MNRTLGDLAGLNIIGIGTGIIAFVLMMLWGRTVRGVWPGRTKVIIFVVYICTVIMACNILYFYSRSH